VSTVAHTLTPPAGVLVFTALAASVHWLTVVLNAASDLLNTNQTHQHVVVHNLTR